MTIKRLKDIVEDCYADGNYTIAGFRKNAAVTSTAGLWTDVTMAPGNPKPNYYTGTELNATVFDSRCSLNHGGNVSPKTKYLHTITMIGNTSAGQVGTYYLCDFLLYYPLIDMDSTSLQEFSNVTALPRYADGMGVKAYLVATNPYIGGQQYYITYTDQDGNEGCTSRVVTSNVGGNIATITNSNNSSTAGSYGPFIELTPNCLGIRSVQSIQFLGPNGGLGCLVLCKPLATIIVNEISAAVEFDFLTQKPSLPIIQDGAVLGFIAMCTGTLATFPLNGTIRTIFN
jgi:hypothetical protein